jgi:hypothetical protein
VRAIRADGLVPNGTGCDVLPADYRVGKRWLACGEYQRNVEREDVE